jgi:hypothetical protein
MIRRFAVLVAGVVALSVGAWYVNDELTAPELKPRPSATATPPPSSQADRLMAFCDKAANRANPLCKVDPNDPEAVRDAVERIVEQAPSTRIIEREVDDDDEAPDVNVSVPQQSPQTTTPSPTPSATTRPPLVPIEIPALPTPPPLEVPDLGLPLLP